MIGLLPATTVVYILLGMGALLPILLLSVIAVTLCARKRSAKPPPAVIPIDLAASTCHTNTLGFDIDLADNGDDDVFQSKDWKRKPIWDAIQPSDCDKNYRKRIAKVGGGSGKMEVISVNNPNVYFRNGRQPKLQDAEVKKSGATIETEGGVPELGRGHPELFSLNNNNNRMCSEPQSCDVMLTSSSGSDSDVVSIGPTSAGHVQTSTGSTLDTSHHVVTSLDRVQSITRSILQQEEERVLR